MGLTMQEVKADDPLRYRTFVMQDLGTLTVATKVGLAAIAGLSGHGGTIVDIRARCLTTPTGATTATYFDLNVNGSTIFTTTGSSIVFTKTAGGAAATTVPNVASGGAFKAASAGKVYNGDILSIDCDDLSDDAAGADCSVVVTVRADEPNDS